MEHHQPHPLEPDASAYPLIMAALYLHIPFCRAKCIYCDFYSETQTHLLEDFLAALEKEIEAYKNQSPFADLIFSTVYFGGGTPSLLQPEQISRILEIIFRTFRFEALPEISLEANPGTVLAEHLNGYRAAGVNRLTLGVQSFDDAELLLLSRIHTAAEAVDAVHSARTAGFDNIGLDLIFGIPGHTMRSWQASLAQAVALSPEHLSIYGLTYEQNTPLWRLLRQGKLERCAEEREREFFLEANKALTAAGYEHYEIANYARPTKRSRHNQMYWDSSPYLGLGPSAHSYDGRRRWWNVRSIERYLSALSQGKSAVQAHEALTPTIRMQEMILLGLRRCEGIDLDAWRAAFGFDLLPAAKVLGERFGVDSTAPFRMSPTDALLACDGKRLGLTLQGVLVYDTICERFFCIVAS